MLKRKCEKITLSKIKIKHVFVYFFKCPFVWRVGAVIFELDKASISSFVELQL